ncbi:TPA: hypothetical protein DEP58_03750 [Patescibacteria group bacterium]|nr:MAG: hypothetical protein UU98_C0008G0002 [Parcubacteria group bacterium GW2011_GWD2_42_14]HCC05388.1 hypothetical protein [Patescibacteria group bacterium]
MKITYVAMNYPPHTGGLELVAQKQAQSAHDAGHEVTVVTFAHQREQLGANNENGIVVKRVFGLHFFETYFGVPFSIGGVGMIRTLRREVRRADIVHLHDVFYMTSWFAYLFARLYHKPILLTQHVALVDHPSRIVRSVQKLVYRIFGTLIFKASEVVIVYNPIVKNYLLHAGVPEQKLLEVRNGIDVHAYGRVGNEEKNKLREKLGLPLHKTLILFVGRFVPKKGYRELYEARDNALYEIVFVGTGILPHAWYHEPGVHILGERSQQEMSDIYTAADIYVAPTKGELFTLAMQEALASGLPVITTYEKEYDSEDLDTSKIVLCNPTPKELKDEIIKCIADTAHMEDMSAYSRSLAENRFSWDKNIESVLALYRTLEQRSKIVKVTTSWDDGHVLDVRVAELLKTYGIQGTFYIAPRNHELKEEDRLSDEQIKMLAQEFEIGAHTMSHRSLVHLEDKDAFFEIRDSRQYLEALVSKKITSFCYPRGAYQKKHITMVKDAGFSLARTVQRFSTRPDRTSALETHTSVHTYDHWSDVWGVLVLARGNLRTFFSLYRKWDKIAVAIFERVREQGGVFHLWGHSGELRDHNDWNRLENVLRHIGGREGVQYVDNKEIYG